MDMSSVLTGLAQRVRNKLQTNNKQNTTIGNEQHKTALAEIDSKLLALDTRLQALRSTKIAGRALPRETRIELNKLEAERTELLASKETIMAWRKRAQIWDESENAPQFTPDAGAELSDNKPETTPDVDTTSIDAPDTGFTEKPGEEFGQVKDQITGALAEVASKNEMSAEEITDIIKQFVMGENSETQLEDAIDAKAGNPNDTISDDDILGVEELDLPDIAIYPTELDTEVSEGSPEDEANEGPEHEAQESPDEEKAEHEPGAEDTDDSEEESEKDKDSDKEEKSDKDEKPDFGDKRAYKVASVQGKPSVIAKYNPNSDVRKSSWTVLVDNEPSLRVFTAQAYPVLAANPSATPSEGEFGNYKFASYREAFASDAYARSLTNSILNSGLEATQRACDGVLLKKAQSNGAMPQGSYSPGVNAEGMNPVGNTSTPPLPPQANEGSPEGEDDNTLNPNPESEEAAWNSPDPEKPLVTDIVIERLAEDVASGVRTVEEIMNEMSAVFGDDEAKAEFEGALSQKADSLIDDTRDNVDTKIDIPEDSSEVMPDVGTSATGVPSAQTGAGNPTNPSQGGMPLTASVKDLSTEERIELNALRTKVAELKKQEELLQKKAALTEKYNEQKRYVVEVLQPRGIVSTVESVMAANPGLPKSAAIRTVNDEIAKCAADLVEMGDKAAMLYKQRLESIPVPTGNPTTTIEDEMRKAASIQGALPLGMGQVNTNKSGVEALLPDNAFKSSLTDLASARNASRQNRRFRGA